MYFNTKEAPRPLKLYNKPLPLVDSWPHLGHTISADETPTADMELRCNQLTGKFHNLRQELGRQDPLVFMTLINVYLLCLYGSSLWDLGAEVTEKVDKTWNSMIRQVFGLPFQTHRYILNSISGAKHIRLKLLSRFKNFYIQLKKSNRPEVEHLLRLQERDQRSVFGRNCALVRDSTNSPSVAEANINSVSVHPVPLGEQWKIDCLKELLSVRRGEGTLAQFTKEDLEAQIHLIYT